MPICELKFGLWKMDPHLLCSRIQVVSRANSKKDLSLSKSNATLFVKGVTDVCIVDRGRNLVSVSRDGTAYLWDVGESKCLAKFGSFGCAINACSLGTLSAENLSLVPKTEEVICM